MATAALNTLAMIRLAAFRLMHSGARDGLDLLLLGLAAIGVAIWAVARKETAKK